MGFELRKVGDNDEQYEFYVNDVHYPARCRYDDVDLEKINYALRRRGTHLDVGRYTLSVQWGTSNYCANHTWDKDAAFLENCPDAEMAAWITETDHWIDIFTLEELEHTEVFEYIPAEAFEDIYKRLGDGTISLGVDIDLN